MLRNCFRLFALFLVPFALLGCQDNLVSPASEEEPSVATNTTNAASPAAQCGVLVPDDESTIQAGVDAASSGQTVCVKPGMYAEDVSVDNEITLTGTTDPTGQSPAVLEGQLSVSGAGATVKHLKVAPATTFDVGSGIDPYGIRVTVGGVTVKENVVSGITGDATGGNSSGTVHGIQIWHPGPSRIANIVVRNNTIRDTKNLGDAAAGWPNYGGAVGIKVQGAVKDVSVTGNTVHGVHSAGWVYGVTLTHTGNDPDARSPENVTMKENTLAELNDGSVYDVFTDPTSAPYPGAAVAIDDTENPTGPGGADADQATVRLNNFLSAPIGTQNKDQVHTLVAECNYWGHASGPSNVANNANKGSEVVGDVDFKPWSPRKIGPGANPTNSCAGGKNEGAPGS